MSSKKRAGKKDSDFVTGVGYSSDEDPDDLSDGSDIDTPSDSDDDRPKRKRVLGSGKKPGNKGKGKDKGKGKNKDSGKQVSGKRGKAWEGQFEHTWDSVREDEQGSLEGAVSNLLLSSRTKRILRDTASIQRGIIRHVFLVLDLSQAMLARDYKATWLDLSLQYAREFVTEFFDQNPISQLAILITREGTVERLSSLSGNPVEHLKALQNKKKLEARGEPSLQNVLEMARSGLSHLPPHGSREVIVIFGSLTTCDPGNIHTTISATEKDRVRVNIIGLSAEMRICRDICSRTKGIYGVAKDDLGLRDLLFEFVSPPPTLLASRSHLLGAGPASSNTTSGATTTSDLMQMGFPTLVHSPYPGLCSCHSKLRTVGFTCPRCKSRICDVPTECRVCGLTVVSSPHLARSYRHLFPVANYTQIPPPLPSTSPPSCYACSFPFPSPPTAIPTNLPPGISPTGRYGCKKCGNEFCLDCDVLIHGALGFCPGCV
ncbi:TFIIH basal transcription factor complex, subunit SSL1 [Meredithblackwellia eburnea MCA 4105]